MTQQDYPPDFRALCAELVEAWDDLPWEYDFKGNITGLRGDLFDESAVDRARAALAQPEPAPSCVACEGRPSPGNSPCHVCGQSAQPDLRAAADQVAKMRPHGGRAWSTEQATAYDTLTKAVDHLLAIAAELEGANG